MTCAHCGCRFTARADARFCSGRCRVAAHRSRRVPRALTDRPRWVRHRNKVPLRPDGVAASSTDPGSWSSFAEVAACDLGDGFGFVLNGDGIAAIDLDGCLTGGVVEPWAQAILDLCGGTYVEVSPSGRGLHVFGFASVGRGRRLGAVEVYDRGRYMTVTGQRFGSAPCRLGDISGVVESLIS